MKFFIALAMLAASASAFAADSASNTGCMWSASRASCFVQASPSNKESQKCEMQVFVLHDGGKRIINERTVTLAPSEIRVIETPGDNITLAKIESTCK